MHSRAAIVISLKNVRTEMRAAAARAATQGSELVLLKHLDDRAGHHLAAEGEAVRPANPASAVQPVPEALLRVASEALGLAQRTALKLLPAEVLLDCGAEAEREGLSEAEQGRRLRTRARETLFTLLAAREFKQTVVASVLGLSRNTLLKLMNDLGLPRASDLHAEEISRAFDQGGDLDAAARLLGSRSSATRDGIAFR